MNPLLIIGVLSAVLISFILFLTIEVVVHSRRLEKLPLRISVSGTRGKTTVTRLAASILRENGLKVLAKTTGTEAMFIYPDGSEHTIHRTGTANILEQKRLVKKARDMEVDCLITEIMSIHPENHRVESRKLIKAQHTLISNFHPDHLDAAANTNMISLYSNDIVEGSSV